MDANAPNERDDASLDPTLVFDGVVGVALAGAFYTSVVVMLSLPWIAWQWGFVGIGYALGAALVGFFFGVFVASVVAIGFALLVAAMMISLGIRIRPVLYSTIVGGLTGFFCLATPLFLSGSSREVLAFLMGPCLALICGQIGGALGGAGHLSNLAQGARRSDIQRQPHPAEPRPFQFGMRHMLVITAWASGVFAALKLMGLLTTRTVVAIALWAFLQTVSYQLGKCIVAWYQRRAHVQAELAP